MDEKIETMTDVKIRCQNAQTVAKWFGVKEYLQNRDAGDEGLLQLELSPGTITLVTGASGAGKSSLLRSIRKMQRQRKWVDVEEIELPDVSVVDCFATDELENVLMLLGRVGLGEVWTYLRTPKQLSEGQRWRLRLAVAMWNLKDHEESPVLVADEFGAILDSITARVVARCLRRTIDGASNIAVLVASTRDDLEAALCPDVKVLCDFGESRIVPALKRCARR